MSAGSDRSTHSACERRSALIANLTLTTPAFCDKSWVPTGINPFGISIYETGSGTPGNAVVAVDDVVTHVVTQ